jgi:hypothetical protein
VLKAGSVALSRHPVAGGIFTARIAVARSDGKAVAGAKVGCGAKIGRSLLHVRGHSYRTGVATCVWLLPRWTTGKRIAGTLHVSAAGLNVYRGFSAKIG